MHEPEELYQVEADPPQLAEPVLVVALDGFVDAGAAGRLAAAALQEGQAAKPLVRFDVDVLIDYRSRRPGLRFESDHWADYSAPALEIVALTDTGGTPYLLLTGPEPDTQWERFVAALEQIVRRFGIRLVIGMMGIPMAVPHTRPIGVTAHATRRELTEGHETWFTTAEVPGSAAALLEYRLGQAGHAAMGFAVHVPHYLARTEYPQAARALLDHVGIAAGLFLPTESLTIAAERAEAQIAAQMQASEEVVHVVQALERQYDMIASGRGKHSQLGLGGELPSAEELAAEVERFLADQNGGWTGGDPDATGEDDEQGGPASPS
ncbi:PAC2 family protein [Pseudonocardia hispaniensis]|uniref:PAC2 family protein n=1 Tax=Pseudonocardia hispaniensis TaxID=904933 RepID=A0ABW1J294_9PSEU